MSQETGDSEFEAAREYYARKDRRYEEDAIETHKLLVDCRGQLDDCLKQNEDISRKLVRIYRGLVLAGWICLLTAITFALVYWRS